MNTKTFGSPVRLGAPAKKRRTCIDHLKCIICQKTTDNKLSEASHIGKSSIEKAAKERKDFLWNYLVDNQNACIEVKYHRKCFQTYTSKTNLLHARNLSVDKVEEANQDDNSKDIVWVTTRAGSASAIDWSVCVVCRKLSHKKNKHLHRVGSETCAESFMRAAIQLRDQFMIFCCTSEEDQFIHCAKYHGACQASYLSRARRSNEDCKDDTLNSFESAFLSLINEIQGDLDSGSAFLMSNLMKMYQKHHPHGENLSYQNWKLERRLKKHFGKDITIIPQLGSGKSNIVMNSSVKLADAVRAASHFKTTLMSSQSGFCLSPYVTESKSSEFPNSNAILHQAVSILRQEMEVLKKNKDLIEYYPAPQELSLQASCKFVPPLLARTIMWLINDKAFENADKEHLPSDDQKRKYLSISECIISNSLKVFTPFTFGLAVQMHHDYGKSGIIDKLSAHGFTINYDEVRRFLTSLATDELQKTGNGIYTPTGLIPTNLGGCLIQEGDDNIDINTETIDGKNTFHSMARVVFQQQDSIQLTNQDIFRVKRSREKSLCLTDHDLSSLTGCEPMVKPKQCAEPPRREDPIGLISSCTLDVTSVKDLCWVLLRLLSRGVIPLPPELQDAKESDQIVAFWSGYNALFSETTQTPSTAVYAPIINAKPSDMATVYTTLLRGRDMSKQLGQQSSIQTMDQQLYAIAQQVKWAFPQEFSSNVVRLGGFHTLSCFISAIGKLWSDGGLIDLLSDSGVYANNTALEMMAGKQFKRATRGLTLAYEALSQILLSSFFSWCEHNGRVVNLEIWNQLIDTQLALKAKNKRLVLNAVGELERLVEQHLTPLLKEFMEWGCNESPTFQYWKSFLDAVEILLKNIKTEREGNWPLHLHSTSEMLPYFFATNRTNYARWLPVYLLDMWPVHSTSNVSIFQWYMVRYEY